MYIFRRIVKLIRVVLLFLPLYHLSSLFKRDSNLWVVGYKKGFLDNSKYFYLQNIEYLRKKHGIKLVWIAQENTSYSAVSELALGEVYKANTLRGLFFLLRAGVYLSSNAAGDDLPYFLSKGAMNVYLWHGIGIKNMKYKDDRSSVQRLLNSRILQYIYPSIFIKPDLMLSTSEHMNQHFAGCFGIPVEDCIVASYPRCSILGEGQDKAREFINIYEDNKIANLVKQLSSFQKVYLYMPTWRDNEPNFLMRDIFEWDKLNDLLYESNSLLILKIHPYSITPDFSQYTNILILDGAIDIYPILPFTNTLITDYSSIYFDYLLMDNKEILLFPFDYSDYMDGCRNFAYDYHEHMPGHKIAKLTDMLNDSLRQDSVKVLKEQAAIYRLYWEKPECDTYYIAKRIIDEIHRT